MLHYGQPFKLMKKHIYIQYEYNVIPFKITLTCNNGNEIIKYLRDKTGQPCYVFRI